MRTRADQERTHPSVCVVGSGWRFTSGISYYTCHLANAFSREARTSALLIRRLLPKRFYPGASRVGKKLSHLAYDPEVDVFDGVDWYWGPSIVNAIRFLRGRRPDVLVVQWWSATVLHTYLALALVARLLRIDMVLEIHELTDTAELRIPGVARYASGGLHLLLRGCKGFVVHSAYDRDQVLARWQLPAERALVVHHGPFDHGPRNSDVADTDVPGEESAIRLLFFGTIRPYKGLEYLIEAFNLLSPEEADKLSLTVVGETWENWIRPAELIETSPYRDRITFVNRYVCDQELHRHLRNADLVVLPYLRSSASGPLHQAMSYGLPVMVTSVGGLLEAAADYEGTTFITPRSAEAIAEGLRSAIASGVRRYQPTGKWSNTVQEYIAFFATIGVAK